MQPRVCSERRFRFASATIRFMIPKRELALTSGDKKPHSRTHNLAFSRGNGADVTVAVKL